MNIQDSSTVVGGTGAINPVMRNQGRFATSHRLNMRLNTEAGSSDNREPSSRRRFSVDGVFSGAVNGTVAQVAFYGHRYLLCMNGRS